MRNSVTIAALAAAVAMAIGVSVMVFSFRRTVQTWVDQTLVADLLLLRPQTKSLGHLHSFHRRWWNFSSTIRGRGGGHVS